ncbi:hypothetical protein BJY24_007823 [Nocardia transvalensis]|uniref:Uncharacterized protein n=1 Tax=Nocardia transvalensis TaxID=37333 RepID=A0A7W9PMJ1_9NOCA|nr:hypothetical protein [Nocardia transvalensis]MBB5918911.1 hypothetical protein [Nocardia transvalensis]
MSTKGTAMSDASVEVLLDDFEDKAKWEVGGAGADRTHLTTFAEGAPAKDPGVYADGAAGDDHRALVLLVRSADDDLEIDLTVEPGRELPIPGQLETVNLWVRSPHASIDVFALLTENGQARDLLLGTVSAQGEWQRVRGRLAAPITGAELLGLRVRLTEVVKRAGEVMILLDDLTAGTRDCP